MGGSSGKCGWGSAGPGQPPAAPHPSRRGRRFRLDGTSGERGAAGRTQYHPSTAFLPLRKKSLCQHRARLRLPRLPSRGRRGGGGPAEPSSAGQRRRRGRRRVAGPGSPGPRGKVWWRQDVLPAPCPYPARTLPETLPSGAVLRLVCAQNSFSFSFFFSTRNLGTARKPQRHGQN